MSLVQAAEKDSYALLRFNWRMAYGVWFLCFNYMP